jgi:hypothetical protein
MNTEAAKKDLGEIRNEVRSLPVEQWPPADKTAWEVACRPSVRLRTGGAASHLRTVTQDILAQRYGLFLDFASRSKRLDQAAVAGGHVTPELVEAYVEELKERVSSVTVYGSIQKLRRITQLIAAKRDLGWLIDIERELFSSMRPRSKWDRAVLTEIIIEAGLRLIAQAEIAKKLPRLHPGPRGPQRANASAPGALSHSTEKLRGSGDRP